MAKKSRKQYHMEDEYYPSSVEDIIEDMLNDSESIRRIKQKYGARSIYVEMQDGGGYYF